MTESEPVGIPAKVKPIEAGEPVPDVAISQLGGTFAERAAARAMAEGQGSKQIDKGDVEDKAVKKASSKKPAK